MEVGSRPCEWGHFAGGIQFHGAAAKRNHGPIETDVFFLETSEISHHLTLRVD